MLHAGNHVIMRVWCVQLNGTHADECCGRAGVQRSMYGVPEVRVLHIPCMISVAGAGLSRVESTGWCRRRAAKDRRASLRETQLFYRSA